jgi:hypothetical protein
MEREPTKYSRPLVVGGLGAVLLGDLAADLPDALFVGGGAAVLLGAAAVHLVGDEGRAAAGWGFFALALGFFGLLDAESTLSLVAVFSLLLAGLALQVSQRIEDRL